MNKETTNKQAKTTAACPLTELKNKRNPLHNDSTGKPKQIDCDKE